jgi:hypothetical protein
MFFNSTFAINDFIQLFQPIHRHFAFFLPALKLSSTFTKTNPLAQCRLYLSPITAQRYFLQTVLFPAHFHPVCPSFTRSIVSFRFKDGSILQTLIRLSRKINASRQAIRLRHRTTAKTALLTYLIISDRAGERP